ncbi:MAG: hypothetical protein N4A76_12130 [Firmicutes bacterium]|jgi:hypothetical protein|nr:hypothetical protein [Bacillota bacterium]
MEYVWVENEMNVRALKNDDSIIHIKWSKKPENDFLDLSRYYINSAYYILKEIINPSHNDNIKYDMWFLPSVYMMRQAIELLLKAGLAFKGCSKKDLQDIYINCKHNIAKLLDTYINLYGNENLNDNEMKWILKYIDSIEEIDSNSDLFRYPFKDDFMEQYGNNYLDIVDMSNRLFHGYSTINKIIYGDCYQDVELDVDESTEFIKLAETGIYNCYLWDSPWSDGFHKQVTGYSEVANFLFDAFVESGNKELFYPIVFSMRNAIEIGLKRLLHIQMDKSVCEKEIRRKKNSHLLYKDLWLAIKPMLIHYSQVDNQDIETLIIAENYIKSISKLDKNGDLFRYPCTYSHEYKFDDEKVDVRNLYNYYLGIFHFIEGCDSWLDYIREIESEMRSEYSWRI